MTPRQLDCQYIVLETRSHAARAEDRLAGEVNERVVLVVHHQDGVVGLEQLRHRNRFRVTAQTVEHLCHGRLRVGDALVGRMPLHFL